MYVLGVGSAVDRAELEEIASRSDYVSVASSFQDLLSISTVIRQRVCAGECLHAQHEYPGEILIQKG